MFLFEYVFCVQSCRRTRALSAHTFQRAHTPLSHQAFRKHPCAVDGSVVLLFLAPVLLLLLVFSPSTLLKWPGSNAPLGRSINCEHVPATIDPTSIETLSAWLGLQKGHEAVSACVAMHVPLGLDS